MNEFIRKIPLTVCPLSNIKLHFFDRMKDHNILTLLDKWLKVTVNSDDPAYFGGYLNGNYLSLARELSMNRIQAVQLARNSFEAGFVDDHSKQIMIERLETYAQEAG